MRNFDNNSSSPIMNINEAQQIVDLMQNRFDSHDFICEYINHFPRSYGQLLVDNNNVNTTHGKIALFLRTNSADLRITKIEDDNYQSYNIFGNLVHCAKWEKIN